MSACVVVYTTSASAHSFLLSLNKFDQRSLASLEKKTKLLDHIPCISTAYNNNLLAKYLLLIIVRIQVVHHCSAAAGTNGQRHQELLEHQAEEEAPRQARAVPPREAEPGGSLPRRSGRQHVQHQRRRQQRQQRHGGHAASPKRVGARAHPAPHAPPSRPLRRVRLRH
jgi:hypothetical protein